MLLFLFGGFSVFWGVTVEEGEGAFRWLRWLRWGNVSFDDIAANNCELGLHDGIGIGTI